MLSFLIFLIPSNLNEVVPTFVTSQWFYVHPRETDSVSWQHLFSAWQRQRSEEWLLTCGPRDRRSYGDDDPVSVRTAGCRYNCRYKQGEAPQPLVTSKLTGFQNKRLLLCQVNSTVCGTFKVPGDCACGRRKSNSSFQNVHAHELKVKMDKKKNHLPWTSSFSLKRDSSAFLLTLSSCADIQFHL